jgi:hypothetical protein
MRPADLDAVDFIAATPRGSEGTVFSCPLCGGRFSHGQQVCSACPLKPGCDVVGCPHCGYQFPRTSAIVETLGRLFRWLGRRRA